MPTPPESEPKTRREKRQQAWRTFRQTLPDAIALARPQAPLWILGLVLMLINRAAGLVLPATPQLLIDRVLPEANRELLLLIVGIVGGAAVLQGVTSFALTQTISKAGQRLIADLRLRIQDHVARLPVRYFEDRKTGDIVSRVLHDVDGVRVLVGTGMVELLGGLIAASLILVILFAMNWKLTLLILLFVALFGAAVGLAFTRLGPLFRRRQEQLGQLSGRLTETISGVRVVKSYRTEPIEKERFTEGVRALLASVLGTITTISFLSLALALLLGGLGGSVLWLAGGELLAQRMTTGQFISYLLYLGFMIAPLSGALMNGTLLSEAFAGLARIRETLGEIREDADEARREPVTAITGRVEFRAVAFAYNPGQPVLRNIHFVSEPGSVTAIVGPSGSGKSTLVSLVASFHTPTEGAVLVDGRNLARLRLGDYRRFLGVVLQETFLFSGTVRENILYARPDADEQALREAARLAHCDEFITRLPQGMETLVGERGVKLSGGQRQRLAIARALLADPRILILDEATSALDSESEAAVQQGLAALMEGRTTFVIAHRLSTVRRATQILVLEDGQIIERGTHDQLMAAGGRYRAMIRRQQLIEADRLADGCPPDLTSVEDESPDAAPTRPKRAGGILKP